MPAKDLGTKHTCFKCSTKFYDLRKAPAICPKCGADQKDSPALKAPEKRSRAPRPAPAVVVPEVDEAEVEAVVDDEELDEDDDDEADDDEP